MKNLIHIGTLSLGDAPTKLDGSPEVVCGEGKAIDGFYAGLADAKSACYSFAEALLVTGAIWILTFALLAWAFPGVS